MKEDLVANAAPRYRAFVSYSHADARFAAWLHRKLEASRLPDGTRLAPIFIDRAELAAGPDLSAQVRGALSESAALVVIASPAARASRWVGQEIELFRQLHPDRPVLAALIAGEPDEAFPDPLLLSNGAALEPLAADFREGQDGKRLGLLKLAAGLSAQPLDRLVQRDAQSRQRRVMAVTAGAVILSLVLSALLVVAIRARAEAERQRAEAEGLVEFMLTDLRDKLRGTGDPKIMASVNQQALDYYARMDVTSLPDDSLERRARVLHAMGEDNERLGNFPAAQKMYLEAWRITDEVLKRHPKDPDAIFAHAQSEFWVGKAAWEQGNLETTSLHWQGYLRQAEVLAKVEPGSSRSALELGYSKGNLCELTTKRAENLVTALEFCSAAAKHLRAALSTNPKSSSTRLALANRLGWQADVFLLLGKTEAAIQLRNEEGSVIKPLLGIEPDNLEFRERSIWPKIGIARVYLKDGRRKLGIPLLQECLSSYNDLMKINPQNVQYVERAFRIAWILANDSKSNQDPRAYYYTQLATSFHSILRSRHSPEKMSRYDTLLNQLN